MNPIDYTIDVQTPFKAALDGYSAGAAIRDDQVKQQQQQTALAQQQQQTKILQALMMKPNANAEDYSQAMLLVPGMKDQLKQAWETKNTAQQQSHLADLSQWSAALQNQQPRIAVESMRARASAMEASAGGQTPDSKALRTHADIIDANPAFGKLMINALLTAHPDGGKVVNAIAALGTEQRAADKAPADLAKAEAEARIKGVEAGNAADKGALDLEKTAEDIRASRENSRIKAMEVALSRETNDLKREELQQKIEDAKAARALKAGERTAEAESAVAGVDNSIALLGDILGDQDTLRAAVGTSAWRGALPGTKARTMAGKIEQLQNAIASTNLDKLKGAMSDKDIMFLKNMETNLDRYQDEDKFIDELNRVFKSLSNARERVVQKYGIAGTPTAEGAIVYENHPKYGNVSTRKAQQLAAKAGLSMDEVMQFLKETGANQGGASGNW